MPNYVVEINIRGGRFGLPSVLPSEEEPNPENPQPYGRFDGFDKRVFEYAAKWLEEQAAFSEPDALPSPAREEAARAKAAGKAGKTEAKTAEADASAEAKAEKADARAEQRAEAWAERKYEEEAAAKAERQKK